MILNLSTRFNYFSATVLLTSIYLVNAAKLTITCDDKMVLYVDGIEVTDLTGSDYWIALDTVDVPDDTEVIAVRCQNDVSDYGAYTHWPEGGHLFSTWSCVPENITGWETVGFDDTCWPPAVDVQPFYNFVDMLEENEGSKFFWTTRGENMAYCRLKRRTPNSAESGGTAVLMDNNLDTCHQPFQYSQLINVSSVTAASGPLLPKKMQTNFRVARNSYDHCVQAHPGWAIPEVIWEPEDFRCSCFDASCDLLRCEIPNMVEALLCELRVDV